ncbi:hypothetical protein [Winogradskyella sp. A3E31]|uniref:hypothetical protein n=1 Tax=Winogradskyella sp. A3E31 TaxID=3349637 RepID=UPI00398B0291
MKIERSNFIRYIGRINYVVIFIFGIMALSSGTLILFDDNDFNNEGLKYFVSISAIIVGIVIIIIAFNIRKEFEEKISQDDKTDF